MTVPSPDECVLCLPGKFCHPTQGCLKLCEALRSPRSHIPGRPKWQTRTLPIMCSPTHCYFGEKSYHNSHSSLGKWLPSSHGPGNGFLDISVLTKPCEKVLCSGLLQKLLLMPQASALSGPLLHDPEGVPRASTRFPLPSTSHPHSLPH